MSMIKMGDVINGSVLDSAARIIIAIQAANW